MPTATYRGTVIGKRVLTKRCFMKKMMLIVSIVSASAFTACKSGEEKTAGAQSVEAVPAETPQVVVKKEVRYVNAPQPAAPVETKKKGWSKAAKGTAIGVGVGAVTGAVVSKNKAKGAVIGGVLGGGAGYIIGRKKDKKDGRVQ
jgi:YMGG-like Gly-zipper